MNKIIYKIILILLVNIIFTIAESNSDFETKSCLELVMEDNDGDNKREFRLKYHTYSFFNNEAISKFSNCFYEIKNDVIICNDSIYHYNYLFYLEWDSHNNFGKNALEEPCVHNYSDIKDFQLVSINSNETNLFNTNSKNFDDYYFNIYFSNHCIYNFPLVRVVHMKSYSAYKCKSGKIVKI